MTFPTGEQYTITSGPHVAVVTELGAGLRAYAVDGRDLVDGFAEDGRITGGRGQQLLPWPNRIRDGRYSFGGQDQQLVLSEPARHNASHGLVRYQPWRLVEHTADRVVQTIRVFPQPGWPGVLDATITHTVGPDGLVTEVRAENVGAVAVPFGYGSHPFLTVGAERIDDVQVTGPAGSYLEVDDRMLPVAVHPVDGTDADLCTGAPLGPRVLDTAMTDLARGSDGRWRVRLEHGERWTELWADETYAWMQVFTGEPKRAGSVAVEPMTCGPDAFNPGPTHAALLTLKPGAAYAGRWGIDGR